MNSETTSRREFIRTAALLGGSAIALGSIPTLAGQLEAGQRAAYLTPLEDYPFIHPENVLYSVCQQCNTQCGIKVKVENGVIAKIDGNPYSPWNMVPHLPYKTQIGAAVSVDALLCPKGQAGVQTAYDPYRIVRVLKRAGKRGENKWTSIPFDQAVTEIVEGGQLFSHVPGEEDRQVQGLRELWAIRDPDVMKKLGDDAKKVAKGKMDLAEFKAKHAPELDLLIDPEHPDLGPKNNEILFFWGRMKAGRSTISHRFFGDGLGTTNRHGHTTVCQGSLYFTGKAMTEQYTFDEKDKKTKWTGGSKMYWMADDANSEFIIFAGASPFEGNYGPTNRAPRITEGLVSGRLKIAVVDPRLSKIAARAWRWVPIKPGTEAAMALGMTRWILDEERYDARYLANANKAAAAADGEPTWSNAPWLVKVEDGTPGKFLRASDLGLPVEARAAIDKKTGEEIPYEFDPFIVLRDGQPVPFDPNDEVNAVEGDLLVDAELGGFRVKSSLQVLRDSAGTHSIAEWAEIAGIGVSDIVDLAREFTSHGKKAAADIHRGVSQHTNGMFNCTAWFTLNLLIGNYNWKGGMGWPSSYDAGGEKKYEAKAADGSAQKWAQPYNIGSLSPGKLGPFGVSLIRHDVKYEESTLFAGYPARRPWFPLASDIYQEIIPSAGDAYPYPIKAAFLHMGSPVYSLPAGNTNIEILSDVEKIPLLVANDIVIGETSMYADYIVPDVTYLERWEFSGVAPSIIYKIQGVRQPVIAPLVETVIAYGQEMPLTWDAFLLGMAEKLGLPNFGPDGFGEGKPLTHPDHLYLKMVANVAAGEKPEDAVDDADPEEIRIFLEARRHLPPSVFDPDRWKAAIEPELWPKVVTVLNRGGRFTDSEKGYDGDRIRGGYKAQINLYQEKTATTKSAMTGEPFPGIATYVPAPMDIMGRPIDDEAKGYDLRMITYREISHTKSRTVSNYWLLALLPENFVLMNRRDARKRGLAEGDQVRIKSASNPDGVWDLGHGRVKPIEGRVKAVEGIRPGVIAFSLGFGHWAYGAGDVTIDGKVVEGDDRRSTGIHANAAMGVDPVLGNTCLSDPVGASAVFFDTYVTVTKV